MKNKVITIGREFGSGGKYIGELTAKKLGIPIYDQEIIDKIAEITGLEKDYITRFGEYAPSKSVFAYSFVGRNHKGESIEDYLFRIQSKVIIDFAKEGPCVIVGRSADYILRNTADTLNVFIRGDMPEKIKRVVELKEVPENKAASLIRSTDKMRRINYKYYTGHIWGNINNYSIMLNSTRIGIEKCAEIIASVY